MKPRKNPTAGFWITVALVAVLLAYPLSFGPACWLLRGGFLSEYQISSAYQPILERESAIPPGIRRVAALYSGPANYERDMIVYLNDARRQRGILDALIKQSEAIVENRIREISAPVMPQ